MSDLTPIIRRELRATLRTLLKCAIALLATYTLMEFLVTWSAA